MSESKMPPALPAVARAFYKAPGEEQRAAARVMLLTRSADPTPQEITREAAWTAYREAIERTRRAGNELGMLTTDAGLPTQQQLDEVAEVRRLRERRGTETRDGGAA